MNNSFKSLRLGTGVLVFTISMLPSFTYRSLAASSDPYILTDPFDSDPLLSLSMQQDREELQALREQSHSMLRLAPESNFEQSDSDNSKSPQLWFSAQYNMIYQYHPSFHAAYSGTNSLSPHAQDATSYVFTLYTGLKLSENTEILFDPEQAGGTALNNDLGLAGGTNLDALRNPDLSDSPYVARLLWHQIIPLSDDMVDNVRGPLSLSDQVPSRRLDIKVGRFSMTDIFDNNSVGSDSHTQFLNWTVDSNGAYDYPCDARGYTVGTVVEYQDINWAVRFGEALMPTVASGVNLQWDLDRAHSENLEFELRQSLIAGKQGVWRFLTFMNHANMGSYRDANAAYYSSLTTLPDVTAHPLQSTAKYGFGVNMEQQINDSFSMFARVGWNNGQTESFCNTEADNTVALGGIFNGSAWGLPNDKSGIALVSNGISSVHQHYLELGGIGFVLGDGALNYGRENILEMFYTHQIHKGFSVGPDLQLIENPGYNQDRAGPVTVLSFRVHAEF